MDLRNLVGRWKKKKKTDQTTRKTRPSSVLFLNETKKDVNALIRDSSAVFETLVWAEIFIHIHTQVLYCTVTGFRPTFSHTCIQYSTHTMEEISYVLKLGQKVVQRVIFNLCSLVLRLDRYKHWNQIQSLGKEMSSKYSLYIFLITHSPPKLCIYLFAVT